MKQEEIDLLEKYGWTVECYSPFEVRHDDGSFASGQAAKMVLDCIQLEYEGIEDYFGVDVFYR